MKGMKMTKKTKDMTSFKTRVLSLLEDFQYEIEGEIYVSDECRERDKEVMAKLSEVMENIGKMNDNPKKRHIKTCSSCEEKFVDEDMIYDSNPFDAEINGNYKKVWMCKNCHHESAMDI